MVLLRFVKHNLKNIPIPLQRELGIFIGRNCIGHFVIWHFVRCFVFFMTK